MLSTTGPGPERKKKKRVAPQIPENQVLNRERKTRKLTQVHFLQQAFRTMKKRIVKLSQGLFTITV